MTALEPCSILPPHGPQQRLCPGRFFGKLEAIVDGSGGRAIARSPASILILAWCCLAGRCEPARHPVVTFFLVATVVTLLGYTGWGAQNRWALPELGKVGLFS